MSWITLTIIAQFLNSIVAIFDKYLVTSKRVTTPTLYVLYTGVLTSLGAIIYIPSLFFAHEALPSFSNITGIGFGIFLLLILTGLAQLTGLWALFSSLKRNDASDVVPVIGSLSALFSLIIGYLFLNTVLPVNFIIGFGLLVFGTLLISHLRFTRKTFLFTLLGGFCFALYSILFKEILIRTSFDTGFLLVSLMTAVLSLGLLFFSKIRTMIHSQKKEKHIKGTGLLMFGNKLIAGVAGVLIIKAIEVGEVSIIQALGGLQFVFLFLIAIVIGPATPIDFGENVKRKDVYSKLTAVSIIFIGFVLLFI